MSRLGQTPSSTVGPFFSMKLAEIAEMAPTECSGQHIRVEGVVLDGSGHVVEDAMIEIWQANAAGRYRHPGDPRHSLPLDPAFTGYGRARALRCPQPPAGAVPALSLRRALRGRELPRR